MTKHTFTYTWSDKLCSAILHLAPPIFQMKLNSGDASLIIEAVNQGIDSHLEAITDSKFYQIDNKLYCEVSPKDLTVLIRRLLEAGDELGLASDICATLGIELI